MKIHFLNNTDPFFFADLMKTIEIKNTNVEDKSKPFTPSCLATTKSNTKDSETARIRLSIDI